MRKKIIAWPLLSVLLTACVTINIYFPAAAAEEAARTIVRDVLGVPEASESAPQDKTGDDQSGLDLGDHAILIVGSILEFAIPVAEAGQANININTPAIASIRASMEKRQSRLATFYKAGAVGFDQSGKVAVRDMSAVSLKQRSQMKKLVADENRDRNALYREIARANGHAEWEADIRKTFSRIWIEEAPAGYWYKNTKGAWVKK